jgi:hypothetical protein
MNWAIFGLAVTGALALIWVFVLTRRRWAWPGLIASIGCLLAAGVNSAATVRALVDPDYVGYGFGLLVAERGLPVTLLAGSILVAGTASALIAAGRRAGPSLWIVAATCAALMVILGVPTIRNAIDDPAGNRIQFGEYLTIAGQVGTGLLLLLLVAPFAIGTVWATRAAMRPA